MSTHLLTNLPVKIFADGADREGIFDLYRKPFIQGLTTNPTLMKKVGIVDYEAFAKALLEVVKDKPISFEVFSDEFDDMRRQAIKIRDWQENVYVKIPITNTRRESALPLIKELASEGVKLNVTALLTLDQVRGVADALHPDVAAVVSVFAGRIADTGVDPLPLMKESLEIAGQPTEGRIALGQRPRGAQHLPGGLVWLPHRDRAARHPGQGDQNGRHGLGRSVAGHRADVPSGRGGSGIYALSLLAG